MLNKNFLKFIYFVNRNKFKIAIGLAAIIIFLGIIGEVIGGNNILKSIIIAISLLGINPPDKLNIITVTAFVSALFLVYGTLFLILFNRMIEKNLYKVLLEENNIILFGFNEINKNFLENFQKTDVNVLVVDKEEKNFDTFYEKGYLFLKKDISDEFLNTLNFEKTTDIIIALGEDRENIDLALRLLEKLKDVSTETKLLIHCQNSEINDLFFERIEKLKDNNYKVLVNVKLFSIYTEIVDDLFIKYDIKLVPKEYALINSNKNELKIAIIGNSHISLELIKRIFVTFIFPNNVKIKLILIDENPIEFENYIKYKTNYTQEKFPHIILENKKLNYDLLKDKNFWIQKDLIDVIITFEDDNKSLELAINLFESVFIYEKRDYPNVYFSMLEELKLGEYINKNNNKFKNFFTFGCLKEIFNVINLLDDEKFEIAKQIHYGYATKYKKDELVLDKKKLNQKWFNVAKYSDKLSNIAQYEHITYKLLSLGLYKEKAKNSDKKTLLKENQKILFTKLNQLKMMSEEDIFKFSCEVENSYDENVNYKFDKEIVNEFFEKFINSKDFYNLINTEHKRWMAYHFLNGWEYSNKKDKSKKLHNCLVELKEFDDEQRKMTIIYDIYSYLYLPNYLAAGNYKIKF